MYKKRGIYHISEGEKKIEVKILPMCFKTQEKGDGRFMIEDDRFLSTICQNCSFYANEKIYKINHLTKVFLVRGF